MTSLIQYHRATYNLALFQSDDGEYWVGRYSSNLTHQNGEPPFSFVCGCWKTLEEGLANLSRLPVDAF